jgi:hypothetical protein
MPASVRTDADNVGALPLGRNSDIAAAGHFADGAGPGV